MARTFKFHIIRSVRLGRPNKRKLRVAVNSAVQQAIAQDPVWAFDGRLWSMEGEDGAPITATLAFQPKTATALWANFEKALVDQLTIVGWQSAVAVEKSREAPGHTDLMMAPEVIDEFVKNNPPPPSREVLGEKALLEEAEAIREKFRTEIRQAAGEAPEDVKTEAAKLEELVVEAPPPPINLDRGTFFSHIFDRDAQISILYSSIKAAVDSSFTSRFHSILFGPPGCGKTEIMRSMMAMLGPDHVLLLDGPGTTKAGAEQLLMTISRIKPFVFIEEIEKMHPAHMQWLLGLLDERGEVRRTNARDGHVQRDARIMAVATVNDLDRFKNLMHGALASRFSHEIYCPVPDEDVLSRIVLREIEARGGDPRWINPAVNYCTIIEETFDPRRAVSVCLSGGDALLDGSYLGALMKNRQLKNDAAKAAKAKG